MKTTENTLSSAMTSSARQWNEEYCCRCCRLAQLVTKMKMKKKKEIMREREKETEEFGPERNNNNNNYNYSYNKPMWFWFLQNFSLFSFLSLLSFFSSLLSLSLSLSLFTCCQKRPSLFHSFYEDWPFQQFRLSFCRRQPWLVFSTFFVILWLAARSFSTEAVNVYR